jgi:hypothetical protein
VNDGKTITASRVNAQGKRTGDADFSVQTVTGGVQVKLGATRAVIDTPRWAEIVQGTLGTPLPGGTVKIRIWDMNRSRTEPGLEVTGWPGVPRIGDLVRLPWRAAARVDDVIWDYQGSTVNVHVR